MPVARASRPWEGTGQRTLNYEDTRRLRLRTFGGYRATLRVKARGVTGQHTLNYEDTDRSVAQVVRGAELAATSQTKQLQSLRYSAAYLNFDFDRAHIAFRLQDGLPSPSPRRLHTHIGLNDAKDFQATRRFLRARLDHHTVRGRSPMLKRSAKFLSILGLISWAFSAQRPNYRDFSLVDLDIAFPIKTETVSVAALLLASVLAPALAIVMFSFLPLLTASLSKQQRPHVNLLRNLWGWHAGWLGLALSLVTSFLVVQGMKNVFGHPRPDMLARCIPEVSRLDGVAVGAYAEGFSTYWTKLNVSVCTQQIGTCSTTASGASRAATRRRRLQACSTWPCGCVAGTRHGDRQDEITAAPPLYLLILPFACIAGAIFITGSRYFNYRHHGFDVLFGALIGILTAWTGFRLYHAPLSSRSGTSIGAKDEPRQRSSPWGAGVEASMESWQKGIAATRTLSWPESSMSAKRRRSRWRVAARQDRG
ncbi:hypothetical protein MRB53_038780 [Persea americana]|nr:hypothetical protein MRB53_038780 [Persea americana]